MKIKTELFSSQIQDESIDEEQGELRGKDDREFRSNAEKTKPQVIWNIERRCFLLPQGSHRFVVESMNRIETFDFLLFSLQNQITRVPFIAVEIVRTAAPTAPKGKKVRHPISLVFRKSQIVFSFRMKIVASVIMVLRILKQHHFCIPEVNLIVQN